MRLQRSHTGELVLRANRLLNWAAIAICVIAGCTTASRVWAAQQQESPKADQSTDSSKSIPDPNQKSVMQGGQDEARNPEAVHTEQKRQIAEETASLLQMAKDLKTEIDMTNSDTLSIAAFRKADAIERLTHDVKEKSKHADRKKEGQ